MTGCVPSAIQLPVKVSLSPTLPCILSVSVVSFPMLLDREVSLATAIQTSARVVTANAAWGELRERPKYERHAKQARPHLERSLEKWLDDAPTLGRAEDLPADYRAALAKIDVPVLLISGRQDTSATEDMVNTMHSMIRGSKLVMLEPAGHLTVVEQPRAFGDAMEAFLPKA